MRGVSLVLGSVLAACGPRVGPTAQGETEGAEEDSAGTTSGPMATTAVTTDSATLATSAETTTTTTDDASGSSTSTGSTPQPEELEGLVRILDRVGVHGSFELHPCDEPDREIKLAGEFLDLIPCNVYAHVRGTFVDCGNEECSVEVFTVEEVLETRLCEPTDCGGTACAPLECVVTCAGSCPDGTKCMPLLLDGMAYAGTSCVDVSEEPVGAGEACVREDTWPVSDDCDEDSVCFGGVCRGTCWGAECDPGAGCAVGNDGAVAVCLPWCDLFADDCTAGSSCADVGASPVCVPDDELSAVVDADCEGGGPCDALEVCVLEGFVPDCGYETCCTPFCDTAGAACPAGTVCEALACAEDGECPDNLGVCVAP